MTATTLPEATAVTLIRRYSTDPQLDEAAEKLTNCGRTFKQYVAAIVVNMLGFVFGTTLGWPAMAGPQLLAIASNKTSLDNSTDAAWNWTEAETNASVLEDALRPLPGPPVTPEDMSWIVAVLCVSCVAGTFIFGWLADAVGRKKAALIGALPYVVSWLCVIFADEVAWLYLARVLAGLGGGSSLVVCPLYVGETSEDSLRGLLGSMFSVMLTAGILFSFVVGSFASFRGLAIVCLTLPCFFFVAFLWLPDTPVFLLSRGKVPLAVRSLTWLRGGRVDLVDDELAKLVANMKDGAEDSGGTAGQAPSQLAMLRQLVATRAARRALFIIMFLFTVQQWCGINAILSFTVQIFEEAGSTMEPAAATIIVGVLQLVGVCSASLVVDRLGRRILLVVSYVSMCTCLLILGGVFHMKAHDQDISAIGWLPVLCLSMYSVTYAVGAGPVPFILVSELFPSSVRSLATSISISFCSILAFIVTKFFEDICSQIGQYGAMWVFAGCSLAGALFAWFGVIETKGKPLAVILHELEGRRPEPRTGPFAGGNKTFNPAPGDIYYSPPDRGDRANAEDREEEAVF